MVEEVRIITGNGTVHRAFIAEGVIFTAEGDNIDQADADVGYGIDEPDGTRSYALSANARELCQRCFLGKRTLEAHE